MKRIGLVVCLLIFNDYSYAQVDLLEAAGLLFRGVHTKLTNYDKNLIFRALEFAIAPDERGFTSIYDTQNTNPFKVYVYPTDMNKDGEEEIFIVFGNAGTSGAAGNSVIVFIKDAGGVYRSHLGFPGNVELISSINKGFSDLLIGGPGAIFPVWRWDGKAYVFYKKISDRQLQYFKRTPVDEVSRAYQSMLK